MFMDKAKHCSSPKRLRLSQTPTRRGSNQELNASSFSHSQQSDSSDIVCSTPCKNSPILSNSLQKSPRKFLNNNDSSSPQSSKKSTTPRKNYIPNSPVRYLKTSPSRAGQTCVSPYKNRVNQSLEFSSSPNKPSPIKPEVTLEYINAANFSLILNEVKRNCKGTGIFNEAELKIVDSYLVLPSKSQELYVRMYGRKLGWHRVTSIHYDKIGPDMAVLFQELEKSGFVVSDYELEELETILSLFKVPELKTLCKSLSLKDAAKKGKPEMIRSLLNFARFQRTISFGKSTGNTSLALLRTRSKSMLGYCINLSPEPLLIFRRMLLIFSLANASPTEEREGVSQQFLLMHLVQIGKMVFPNYSMITCFPIFKTREQFLMFDEAREVERLLEEAVSRKEWSTVLTLTQRAMEGFTKIQANESIKSHDEQLPVFLRKFTAGSTYAYTLMTGAEALKKDFALVEEAVVILRHLLAQNLYLCKYRGRWYELLALLLQHHLHQNTEAALVLLEAFNDDRVTEVSRRTLFDRGEMLVKRKTGPVETTVKIQLEIVVDAEAPLLEPSSITIVSKSVQNNKPGFKKIYILEDFEKEETTYSSVEEYALSHYRTLGYDQGIHCEGTIIIALFGLFFWDIIYELPVPNVFQSPYQSVPLDLNSHEFYNSRQCAIDQRLCEMHEWEEDKVNERMEQVYKDHEGKISLVNWERFRNVQHVNEIVNCMGIKVIAKICERLVKHYKIARSGFPDLMVWAPDQSKCKFVEVKGKGDTLSVKQRVWLDYLKKVGADAEVCLVNHR